MIKNIFRTSTTLFSCLLLFALCNTTHAAGTISKITHQGAYQSNGNYIWDYAVSVMCNDEDLNTNFDLTYHIPDGFPFTIEQFPAHIVIPEEKFTEEHFRIVVPSSYITNPANLQKFEIEIQLSGNGQQTNRMKTSVQAPLPAHPRLMIGANGILKLREKIKHSDFEEIRKALASQRNYETDGIAKGGFPDDKIRAAIEASALEYLLNGKTAKEYGFHAIQTAGRYLASITDVSGYRGNVWGYEAVMAAAMVYDWCYDLLTTDDKTILKKEMNRVCSICEYSYPDKLSDNYFSGHYGEQAPTVFLSMGIALYDEDTQMFDFAYDEQVNKFAPSRNPMYASGAHHQGAQYMHVRYTQEILQAFILKKIGLNCYNSLVSSPAYKGIYLTIPQKTDMDGMPDGDGHNHIYMSYEPYLLSASMSGDPALEIFSRHYLNKELNRSTRSLLYHDPDIRTMPVDSLPTSRFFPSPSGILMARTKWDIDSTGYGSNAMVVQMNMKEYNARNHDQLDAGHFSIYYKGHLAIDAGIYQGEDPENGWGKKNFVNYYMRTVAHNSLLIRDPDEPLPVFYKKKVQARDGGQHLLNSEAWRTSQEMFAAGKVAEVMAVDIAKGVNPEYSYMKGDMTNAYKLPAYIDKSYPAKVDTVRRSFVFLNFKSDVIPGALIVMDKVVSRKPDFQKVWLLHTQNEPKITGNIIENESTQGGRNGKLHTTVLLPELENQKFELVGGKGKEYVVDGVNWGSVTQEDAGRWRVELSPKNLSRSDNFLNVIQAMDANPAPKAWDVKKIFSVKGDYVIVEIADWLVAQQLNLGVNNNEIEFTARLSAKEYNVLVTDLKPGRWQVTTAKGEMDYTVAKESGTLRFLTPGGNVKIVCMEW